MPGASAAVMFFAVIVFALAFIESGNPPDITPAESGTMALFETNIYHRLQLKFGIVWLSVGGGWTYYNVGLICRLDCNAEARFSGRG